MCANDADLHNLCPDDADVRDLFTGIHNTGHFDEFHHG
jgi:hypothetical protein